MIKAPGGKHKETTMAWFDGFEQRAFEVNGAHIHARFSQRAPGEAAKPALL